LRPEGFFVYTEKAMKYGLYLPNYGAAISARNLANLAHAAEEAGWDGFFIWDHILISNTAALPMVDPWVALSAMAMATSRIKLGTTVTPIARRRPWKLARETATLDHLSEGRLILSVGLGGPEQADFESFSETTDARLRSEMLDEGLEILVGLWSGKPFSFEGKHYQLKKMQFAPASFQKPRIPIWVGANWPNKNPLRRAAKWDGVFPLTSDGTLTPKELGKVKTFIQNHRTSSEAFDLVTMGCLFGLDEGGRAKFLEPLRGAGLTWWLESLYDHINSYQQLIEVIEGRPPGN
jgi:alkanesulfonate monooxygenase SsuD/methylene tetrahydromethanopterin reductase-like flavin-dependent oxidoreductase (luciferase family)